MKAQSNSWAQEFPKTNNTVAASQPINHSYSATICITFCSAWKIPNESFTTGNGLRLSQLPC